MCLIPSFFHPFAFLFNTWDCDVQASAPACFGDDDDDYHDADDASDDDDGSGGEFVVVVLAVVIVVGGGGGVCFSGRCVITLNRIHEVSEAV